MATPVQMRDSLDALEDKIEYLLKFVTIISELILLLGLAYAGFKLAHRGPTPETLDQIWLVSQVLALDLSAPGLFAMATRAREQGNERRATWAIRIAIVLIIMSILTMVEGAITSYLPGIPQNIILYVTLFMMIIRAGAAVGYSVFRRLHKAANSPLIPVVVPSVEENAVVAQLESLQQQLLHVTAQLESVKVAPVVDEPAVDSEEDEIETKVETNITSFEDAKFHLISQKNESEMEVNPRITKKLNQEKNETKNETNIVRGAARQKALRAIKRNPEIGADELAKRVGITPQYARQIMRQQSS